MALKLARIATGGRSYISTVGAFHGKSMGAISMGGKGTYRVPYAPMVQQVQHVEYGNAEDVRKAIRNLQTVGEKVAAVILEPIQGEAGVIIPPKGYLKEVREICDEYGVALISHACFYTDATVLSSNSAGIDNMEHALSQWPYVFIAAGISSVLFLTCGIVL